jgi:hypothetical protein
MGYLNAVAGTKTAPRVAAASELSWRLGSPAAETEADETMSELDASRLRETEAGDDSAQTPASDRSSQDKTEEEPKFAESKESKRDSVADGPRLRPPRHQPLATSDSTKVVLPEPTDVFAQDASSRQAEVSSRIPPEPITPAGQDLPAGTRPGEPTRNVREGPRRIAELRVPARAYPGDLMHRSPMAIRTWLSEHPEIIAPERDETPVGITIERLVFEHPPAQPSPGSEPRERPQPQGFAEFDSIRRR